MAAEEGGGEGRGGSLPPTERGGGQACLFAAPKIVTEVFLRFSHKPTAGRAQFGKFSSTKVRKSEHLVLKIVNKIPNKYYICLNNAFTTFSEVKLKQQG